MDITSVINEWLQFAFWRAFLYSHVAEFAGFEDLAALHALHKLGVFVTADNLDAGVLASELIGALGRRRRLWSHKSGWGPKGSRRWDKIRRNFRVF